MKRFTVAILIGSVAITGLCTANAAHAQLDRSCKREIVKLCGMTRDRKAIRGCLKEKSQNLSAPCLSALKDMRGTRAGSSVAFSGTLIRYGSDAKQALDYYPVKTKAANTPLVIFIHGGGWSIGDKATGTGAKADYFTMHGAAFASINYRLVPNVTPADQASDVAAAIANLRKKSAALGFDPDQVILMGHSAGAHLAALVSSDPSYLKAAGVPMSSLRATILLDGAGYDVPRQMANGQNRMKSMYRKAFTTNTATQKSLSPYYHAASPNAAKWLILHDAKRPDSGDQSRRLAAALNTSGAQANVIAVPDSNHMEINRTLGIEGSFVTNKVAAFLKQML